MKTGTMTAARLGRRMYELAERGHYGRAFDDCTETGDTRRNYAAILHCLALCIETGRAPDPRFCGSIPRELKSIAEALETRGLQGDALPANEQGGLFHEAL